MLFKNQEQIIKNGQTQELKKIRGDVLDILVSAIDAVNPYTAVKAGFNEKRIDVSNFENIYLVGFGKASVGMAQAVCDSIDIKKGIIITNDPHNKVKSNKVTTLVGAHPIPNQKSIENTNKILDLMQECNKNDLLIALISGGGSALLCKPRVKIKDIQRTTDLLLKSGANINEINTVRKHLSFVKGGQLAAYAKCSIISFIISDIIGDPLESIASGPTYPDPTTYFDAQKILEKYDLWGKSPISVNRIIEDGKKRKISETLKENDPIFNNVFNFLVANNEIACKAAENKAKELGYKTMVLTTSLTGEASKIGEFLVERATSYFTKEKKIAFISSGETTVAVKGNGKGGRNLEMVLGGIEKLADKDVVFSSFATDGIDGNCDAAGAVADAFTLKKAQRKGLDSDMLLNENNSYEFFKKLGDLLFTGPTGTNVMDIQILIKIQ